MTDLFHVVLPAPKRSSLSVLKEESVNDPLFGSITRKRLYNLRHYYEPSFPPFLAIGEADGISATPLKHPLEWMQVDGSRPDPLHCIQRLRALWLISENRGGQLSNDPVLPFRHQAALLDFLLRGDAPRRVLIADEVGLGKTVEAGLLIRELLRREPSMRVLYLTLGGLVENVLAEFERLDLPPWGYFGNVSEQARVKLRAVPLLALTPETKLVVASIHKLCASDKLEEQRRYLGDSRFDLIIVDECHTLRAYGPSADSQQVWFRAVRHLIEEHLTGHGRALFLSATPHQGHREVFLNLMALCTGAPLNASEAEKAAAARGRIVFRIKEHVRDWEGKRIFPPRDVKPPELVEAPAGYRRLLDAISEHFDWIAEWQGGPQARAIGFTKSQALQYAASSLRAGFAYLLRRLIRYFPSEASDPEVVRWAGRLIPYRGTIRTEHELLAAWRKEATVRADSEDLSYLFGALSEGYGGVASPQGEEERLKALLRLFDQLLDDANADAKFLRLLDLVVAADEPVVVFSQAVDTVYQLEQRLGAAGIQVHRLTGDMSADERVDAISKFRTSSKPLRVLVSSAAGGVGINLQVSRRIIHFDLPWNPMALEQRVGRVHRIGSTKTILVETILLSGSREAEVFERITARLEDIVTDLSADPVEREAYFRRILASLDPDRLRALFSGEGSLDSVGEAVDAGRLAVEDADRAMSQFSASTSEQRGRATTEHLMKFLRAAQLPLHVTERRLFAVISEGDDGDLRAMEEWAEFYDIEYDEPVVFNRVAASYLGLRRSQTGGLGHPAVDPILRAAADVHPDMEKARTSTWLRFETGMPDGLQRGDVVVIDAMANVTAGSGSDLSLQAYALRAGTIVELNGDVLEQILWGGGWTASQKAGDYSGVFALLDHSTSARGADVRWPIAAIGIR